MKAGDFTDPVRAAWLKRSRLFLRHLVDVTEHLAGAGEVKTALGPQFTQSGEHVMRAVDVHVHRRKAVGKAFRDETLGRQVVTLVEVVLAQDVENTRITFETRRMERD